MEERMICKIYTKGNLDAVIEKKKIQGNVMGVNITTGKCVVWSELEYAIRVCKKLNIDIDVKCEVL